VSKSPNPHRPNPLAFLSSTLRGIDEVRARIHRFGRTYGENSIWVDEQSRPRHKEEDHLSIVDDLLAEIDRSRLFIAFLGSSRHGSSIYVGDNDSAVSFFEMELLYAALLGRPIVVVNLRDIVPQPALAQCISMLRSEVRCVWHDVDTLAEAERSIELVVEGVAREKPRGTGTTKHEYGRLLRSLWERDPSSKTAQPRDTNLRWLDGAFLSQDTNPRSSLIADCLNKASTVDSQQQRLSRIWIAARELMSVRFDEPDGIPWLGHWNAVLTAWNSAAAWYGLHGHLSLGYLAALNSLAEVRAAAIRESIGAVDDPVWDPPTSSQASAYYALGRRVTSRRLRHQALNMASSLIEESIARDDLTRSNKLAIKGSILREQFAFRAAVDVYREVLRLRQAADASDGAVGEAMTELGFGLLFLGQLRSGRDLLSEGVTLMTEASYNRGFLVRAKRKLAVANALTGRWRVAMRERLESATMAEESSVGRVGRI
jgi:hypothetical protein